MTNVRLLYGPMLIGVFLNMILYGILVVQMYSYYQVYRNKDSRRLKLLILYLLFAESANTALSMFQMYQPLILQFGTQEALTFFPMMFPAEPLLIVVISAPIQSFFAWRIWRFVQSIWIPILICLLAAASLGGGIWTAVKIITLREFVYKPLLHTPALVWLVTAAAADILITVSLVYNLYVKKTGDALTDDLLDRMSALTIRTGLLTALFAILDVIFFLSLPHTTINLLWDLCLTKMYSISLLSTLNARATWNTRLITRNQSYNDERTPPTETVGRATFRLETMSRLQDDRALYELESSKL